MTPQSKGLATPQTHMMQNVSKPTTKLISVTVIK